MFKKVLTTALVLSSSWSYAVDFKDADSLFAQREGNPSNTQAAINAYLSLAKSATGRDLERAVVGAARAYIYQGEGLTGRTRDADIEKRRQIFRSCWKDTVPMISPEKLGYETPSYYYFTAVCMAYYSEVSGTLENLTNAPKLVSIIQSGYQVQGGDTFEGGGIKRVNAAVISNPKAKPIPGNFYNPTEALKLIDEAINASAYPGGHAGYLFCENYRRKANVLKELQRNDEALELAESAIVDFDLYLEVGEIPDYLVPETKHCLNVIKGLVTELSAN